MKRRGGIPFPSHRNAMLQREGVLHPDRKTRLPVRRIGVYEPSGLGISGRVKPSSAILASVCTMRVSSGTRVAE
eukprot:5802350-Pleurochrysis_carterae.AAC.4